MANVGKRRSLQQRFFEKVNKNGPSIRAELGQCWIWTAYKNEDGYGRFQLKDRPMRAHRVSWEMCFGPIPNGSLVLHKCDNAACVNPNHLELGTNLENARQMKDRGRQVTVRGEAHSSSKLTEAEVREILELKGRLSQEKIALQFRVHPSTIFKIHKRIKWRHLTGSGGSV